MIVNSIRGRIQLWHTALLAILMAGLLTAFYFHDKEIRIREFDNSLMAPITSLIPHFAPPAPTGQLDGPPNDPNYPRPQMRQDGLLNRPDGPNRSDGPSGMRPLARGQGHRVGMPNETAEERQARQDLTAQTVTKLGLYLVALNGDGSVYYASYNAPSDTPLPQLSDDGPRRSAFIRTIGMNRECVHMAPGRACVIIGASTEILGEDLGQLRWTLAGTGIGIVAFAYLIGWILVGRSLKPIRSITQTAAQIAAGDLTKRIDLSDTESELGQMAEVLNNTFTKLENSFDQQVRFTADASHELRTPIAVILAKCQFALMRDREPEKYQAALKTCEASAQHVRTLIESLLELARVDSGEFAVLKSEADLGTVASSCAEMLSALSDKKQLKLDVDCPPTPAFIDPDRMHQVIINLLSNAIKYTQQGSIEITTRTEGDYSVLQIRDTGSGIDPEHLPHLFDRFYRSSNERSDDRRSTGLGLAISKAIVEAHLGTITVESTRGVGSCFTVRIPA